MKVRYDINDIFAIANGANEAVCVTTNGVIKNNGCAVMGAGIAKACAELFPDIPLKLGYNLKNNGNRVYNMGLVQYGNLQYNLITFPTKHHWRDNSDKDLIRLSCKQLKQLCIDEGIQKCYLPQPGCTNGHLDWEVDVEPILHAELDDRFIVVIRR